ncbi:MAG TPA: FGGY family carbohydrate kinase [Casimicrobiaceae bacterium]|nr:FGGY family carbohydrate kinase [Casimicrobiaceae bacterium]
MPHVIGVDIGTQSTKAVLMDERGQLVAQASTAYLVDSPHPLWAEQWPQVWMQAVENCIRGVVAGRADVARTVKALCISSLYGGSGIPVDVAGAPLAPCLIWMDRRAQDEAAWVRANVDLDRLHDITGNGVDSYYGYTKMLWLREKRPEVWKQTHRFVPPNAYVIAQLTGEWAVDHSSAGNIGGVYDIRRRQWSEAMLEALGIPPSMMPPRLVESSAVVGTLARARAADLGLPADLPVVAGGVDAAVATLAAGARREGNHVAMIGTSMCWGTIRKSPDARHGLIAMPHVLNGLHDLYVFGGASTAGASVTWFRENFCEAEVTAGKARGIDPHVLLEAGAAALPAGGEGLLFLPYLMGERSPIWDAQASGAFVGLGLHHGRAHLYRAVLEGVTYALQHNIETGSSGSGVLDEAITVVGGASRSDLWMQMVADVTRRPVYTIPGDVEASLGAAMLAALAVGLADTDALFATWVKLERRAEPREGDAARYAPLYRQYVALYPALKGVMHALKAAG